MANYKYVTVMEDQDGGKHIFLGKRKGTEYAERKGTRFKALGSVQLPTQMNRDETLDYIEEDSDEIIDEVCN